MEFTESHVVSSIFFFLGMYFCIAGKINVEFGLTGGQSQGQTKFIKSKKATLEGIGARCVGALFSIFGILLFLFLDKGEILFVL